MITVAELVKKLQEYPAETPVCYERCSEHCALELHELYLLSACPVREDGWVHDERPDKPSINWLCFPGN